MRRLGGVTQACVVSGLLLSLACAGARPPIERPLGDGDPRPAALLEALAREGESRRALRGVAKLSIDGPGGSGRARQIVLVERPARLRVEILGLLDQTVGLLVTDGVHYRVVRSDRSVERGAVHAALLAEVAGIALAPELAVRVLLGAPLDADARSQRGAALGDDAVRVFLAPGAGLEREMLDFDADAQLRRWARLGADGEPLLEARYDDWRATGGVPFPFALELVDHTSETTARIAWSDVELDPALAPSLFDVRTAP